MKLRSTVLLVAGVVAMGLLAGTSAAQETEVIVEGNNATGIRNLTVGSDLYDVIFVVAPGVDVYPGDPPEWDFSTEDSAKQARDAVADALNAESEVRGAGPPSPYQQNIRIGYRIVEAQPTPWIYTETSGWGPIDGWSKLQAGTIVPFNQTELYARFVPLGDFSPEPAPPENSDGWSFVRKQFTCPQNNVTLVPAGSRFGINDIAISTDKDQTVTLKFNPSKRVLLRLFLKSRQPIETNLSGLVESENQQALLLDCGGNANTTLTITITGNGNL